MLALNIRCLLLNCFFVVLLRSFQCNFLGKVRFYWDSWGKMGEKGVILGNMEYQRGNRVVMLLKQGAFSFYCTVLRFFLSLVNLVKA